MRVWIDAIIGWLIRTGRGTDRGWWTVYLFIGTLGTAMATKSCNDHRREVTRVYLREQTAGRCTDPADCDRFRAESDSCLKGSYPTEYVGSSRAGPIDGQQAATRTRFYPAAYAACMTSFRRPHLSEQEVLEMMKCGRL